MKDVHGTELTEAQEQWAEDNEVRIEPFTKTNWKSAEARDEWNEWMTRMRQAKDAAEWLSVMDDRTDRTAAIIHVNNHNRETWLQRISEHDLVYRPIRYSEPYDGFSHKHRPTDKHDPERVTYAVISESEEIAEDFVNAESEGEKRHSDIGEYLGFPECCREFFGDVWLGGTIDPMYEIAENSGNAEQLGDNDIRIVDPDPRANILWRYFGVSFITHIPCSFDCEHTHEIAQARGEIMADNGYKEEANRLFQWLSMPHIWTGHNGLMHIRNQYIIGSSQTSTYWNERRIVWDEKHKQGGSIV